MNIDLNTNPIKLFADWFDLAKKSEEDATAMVLATATKEGLPSARVVLLKDFDERGFVFYTNTLSHKGDELRVNPHAALCFYWPSINKQVRIEGHVVEVTPAESDKYFATRARESQLGAWASEQSRALSSLEELEQRFKKFTQQFADKPVARPDYWIGFRVVPHRMEFWQRGNHRLHQRACFEQKNNEWLGQYLYP